MQVFIADKDLCFRECIIKEANKGQVTCFDEETYKIYTVPSTEAFPVNPEHMAGVSVHELTTRHQYHPCMLLLDE